MEDIEKHISAAFDSVNLINSIIVIAEPTEDQIDTIDRNKSHLLIMLNKEEFINALTQEQLQQITAASI